MKVSKLCGVLLATLLAAGAAQANVITYQGVTFTTTTAANVLTLEIDAATHTGDWATATTIGALELKGLGSFSSVSLTAPGSTTWTRYTNQLNGNGCAGGAEAADGVCFSGSHITLSDNMIFKFTFNNSAQLEDTSAIKVNFFVGNDTRKVGSLQPINEAAPAAAVPEPGSTALLFGGLLAMGAFAMRRRTR